MLRLFLLAVGGGCLLAAVWIGPLLLRAVGAAASPRTRMALMLGAGSFALALQIQLMGALLRAAQQFVPLGRAIALGSVLLPLCSYSIIRVGLGLGGLVLVNLGVNVVVLTACWMSCKPLLRSPEPERRLHTAYLVEMMRFGGWSTVSRVVLVGMLQMDRLAVALVGQVSGLTYYAVPANLASRVNTFGGPAANLFFGRAASVYAMQGRAELARQHAQAVRFLLWTAVALAVPLVALGPTFLGFWLGPEMAHLGSPILIVLACGYFLSSIGTLHGVTLEAIGYPSWTAKNMLGWSLPVLVGVFMTVDRYGSFAVGIGVAVWQSLVAVTNIFLCRYLGLDRSGREWAATMGAVLVSFSAAIAFRSFASGVFTCVLLMGLTSMAALAMGAWTVLTAADRSVVRSLFRRRRERTIHSRTRTTAA